MGEILFLNPVFKEMIWGGNRLRTEFGYTIPEEDTGECWAVSAHQNGDCEVISDTYHGITLSQLWNEHRELFGNMEGDVFPLLVKIIDAKQDLSIQVHPDDKYAIEHENGSLGKTECWYVLDCDENAQIVIGHNAKNKQELEHMIHNEEWDKLIRTIPLKKGDFFQIEPGTVHAIKGGTLILETQQNSDITYRLYDYGRLQNGKPRQLHLQQSINVIQCPFSNDEIQRKIINFANAQIEQLVECKYYTVQIINVKGSQAFEQSESFTIFSVIDGEGSINGKSIHKGDHFILPNGYGQYEISGTIRLIKSFITQRNLGGYHG